MIGSLSGSLPVPRKLTDAPVFMVWVEIGWMMVAVGALPPDGGRFLEAVQPKAVDPPPDPTQFQETEAPWAGKAGVELAEPTEQ
jgi:hypothetical protein